MNKDVSDSCYTNFTAFLQSRSGIALGDAKQYLVKSRLTGLMLEHQIDDINVLIENIVSGSNAKLSAAAIDAMTTNETLWFRDSYPFDLLKSEILPSLITKTRPIKVWSAACSSGQEAYSIAMTYKEFVQAQTTYVAPLSISATDISPTMLALGKAAIYDELSLSRGGLTPQRRSCFFKELEGGRLGVIDELKQMVSFKQHNLINHQQVDGPFDIIFCRNVLIYFPSDIKLKILQHFAASLSAGGILFLGASESIGAANQFFNLIRCGNGLYYQLKSI